MSDLRKIIVNATSEMLDEPNEHGIYNTTRFYDRLEKEVTEHFDGVRIVESPFMELMLETVKNSPHVTPRLQNAIAQFMEFQSKPVMYVKSTKVDL